MAARANDIHVHVKRKRKVLTIEDKVNIIKQLDSKTSATILAEHNV